MEEIYYLQITVYDEMFMYHLVKSYLLSFSMWATKI